MNVKIFNGAPEQVEKDLAAFMAAKFKFKNAMLQRNGSTDFRATQSQSVFQLTNPEGGEPTNVVNLTVTIFWE